MDNDPEKSSREFPKDTSMLGLDCPSGHEVVNHTYDNQATTQCQEGIRHRWKYYCKDPENDEVKGPYYTNWICGQ